LTTIFVGVYMVIGTFEIKTLGGNLSLGTFLATINVFKEVGMELQEIYGEIMEIQTTFGPLRKVAYFMNLPTDLDQRMSVSRLRLKLGKERTQQARDAIAKQQGYKNKSQGRGSDTVFAVDTVDIEMCNVTFGFVGYPPLIKDVSRRFQQGKLYAFVGPHHEGKETMLKLLGQVYVPSADGCIMVPPHLRILHISQQGCILNASFVTNVVLNQDVDKLGGIKRLKNICERCRFSKGVLRLLDEGRESLSASVVNEEPNEEGTVDHLKARWAVKLSQTDYVRLNLVRAFAMNPECLVMHQPLGPFSDEEAKVVFNLLRAHVDERGIELPEGERKLRRPRTVFFSSCARGRCMNADYVYRVSMTEGLVEIGGTLSNV